MIFKKQMYGLEPSGSQEMFGNQVVMEYF